jgi:nucleotide-binding universal stress UspA family protein
MTESHAEILVYVDPSQRGEWAIGAALPLVPKLCSKVALLATAEDLKADPQILVRARARFEGRATVREIVEPGPAEKAVLTASERGRFTLLVVPPAGRKALARLIKGSRVATVVRQVRSTVLIARRPPQVFKRLVVAIGGGVHSVATAMGAAEVATALSAHLEALHVDSSVELPPDIPWVEKREPSARFAQRNEKDATLAEVAQVLASRGFPRPLRVRRGMIVEEVLAEVEEMADDLLILGAHRAAGADRWMLDDVTEQILLRCPISILVIRAPEPAN